MTDTPSGHIETFGPVYPDDHYKVIVDGCEVPYLRAYLIHEDTWRLEINRWGGIPTLEVRDHELRQWAYFLAQYGAICAGYTHFGADGRMINPFAMLTSRLSGRDFDDSEISLE